MKYIHTEQTLDIPEGVTVNIKARIIKVTGPRGSLTKNLQHIDVTFQHPGVHSKHIKIIVHNGDRKHVAALRTVRSLVNNMIIGVTQGFRYKMRYVYAHFPINVNIIEKDESKYVEIRNYLGEKKIRAVYIREGVTVEISSAQKDELIVSGNSLDDVSQTCADVQQQCRARNKDIRKFLDGIYVSHRGVIEEAA
ncbi:60S ribosomal protein uL6 [Ascoidea rubescens DSM 1968]|uniref:L8 n=1 Tax=Ascoidea rubescens DSM 1968 TaxID=1344418 RepID=A0A1D2VAA1_9ASCO|nr:ribosomal protein L6 [Ascoidea rubescens DSM 1968]ODV58590.1 ribosomal protein L6 [Ascoidea rubescens DSM 1968]